MLTFSHSSIMNMENAIRGARNPMNNWVKSDSYSENGDYILGANDLDLAQRLCQAGSDHRKFMRQILVSVDINAPLYWWKEFDTYKVGTVANSTSTMHKIHSKPFSWEDFSTDFLNSESIEQMTSLMKHLEKLRLQYLGTRDQSLWYSIIQLLPSSYNQLRTCTMNYEILVNIYRARKNHKLHEWHILCDWIETLPYARQLILPTD